MTTTPNINIPYVPENTLDPAAGLNLALNFIDALLQTAVISMDLTAPPMTNSDGDLYIVAGTGGVATGAWSGHELDLARYVAEGDFWQFFQAGVEVHYVINRDDGNLYKFVPGSPGSWVLAAGLGDAPADGQRYVRRDAAWETLTGILTVRDTDSPPTVDEDDVHTIIVGAGLQVAPVSPGVVMFNNALQYAPVIDVPDQHTDALAGAFGNYMRFTHAAAEFHFSSDEPWEIGAEYHGHYAGSGTLTITADSGFTINPPAGGSLVIPPGGTFTVKIVAADEADLIVIAASAGSGGSAPLSPDTPPASPNPADDEFEGSTLDTAGTRRPGATPWAWLNQGTATASLAHGALLLTAPASTSQNLRIIEQIAPSPPWVFRAKLRIFNESTNNFASAKMVVRNSANGRIFEFGRTIDSGNKIDGIYRTSVTAYNSHVIAPFNFTQETRPNATDYLYFELASDGMTCTARYSYDGMNWLTAGSFSIGAFLGGIDRIGLMANSENNRPTVCICDWFRRIS